MNSYWHIYDNVLQHIKDTEKENKGGRYTTVCIFFFVRQKNKVLFSHAAKDEIGLFFSLFAIIILLKGKRRRGIHFCREKKNQEAARVLHEDELTIFIKVGI